MGFQRSTSLAYHYAQWPAASTHQPTLYPDIWFQSYPRYWRIKTVTNSLVFAQHVRDQPITEHEIMVSFDVVALFTSIPVDLALQIVREKLQQDATLTDRTDIYVTNIMKLLEFVLKNSFFTYEMVHYQQTFGCAMGSPVSATTANLVMEHIKESAIATATHPPRWWYRYVDDSHACLKKDYIQEFHDHLNSVNP